MRKEIYKIWAPTGCKWVDWVRPVPFVGINYGVNKYSCNIMPPVLDFVIPKEKLAIEVDGSIYHYYKKTTREATIQWSLGLDWTIIHVPADRLSRQIYKLQEVIDALRSLRYQ